MLTKKFFRIFFVDALAMFLFAAIAAASVRAASAASQNQNLNQNPATAANAKHSSSADPSSPTSSNASTDPWWKHAVIYEVYPRSLQDSNGDGIGDLNGIMARLDALKDLGVNAIWLTPTYPSPQVDFGYDISNYEAIDPMYGTMADFDRLVSEAKKRNIRVIMDMVMNHTSDQHPWFLESRSSRDNPKRNWYVWRDGKGPGQPPNNWQSLFGHSAWTYDAKTQQWYYHKFYAQQPDLNWNNPDVQQAMFDVVRFWLNRGVAGFRLDAITTLFEDTQLRDEKILQGKNAFGDPNEDTARTDDLPQVQNVLRALRKVVDEYTGQRVLIGETYLPNIQALAKMYGANHDKLQLPMDMQVGLINRMDVQMFRKRIDEAETQLRGNQPLFVFDNHDNPRSWDRYGDGAHNAAIAHVIAAILLTTRSTALMYYGQEIGMKTTPPKTRAAVQDPMGKTGWPKEKGRDGERTPMQWTPGKDAGFSTAAKTWLPVEANYKTVNVQTESGQGNTRKGNTGQPNSLYLWYKHLIALRSDNPALRNGANIMVNTSDTKVLAYLRKNSGEGPSVLVAMNFTAHSRTVHFDLRNFGVQAPLAKTLLQYGGVGKSVSLRHIKLPPFAVWIGEVK